MRISVLGYSLPDDQFDQLVAADAGSPFQTQRFGRSLLRGLASTAGEVDAISFAPAVDYPRNKNAVFRRGRAKVDGVVIESLPFINLIGLKHITRSYYAWRALGRRKRDWVLIHGVNSSLLWAALFASRTGSFRIGVVLTDPPSVPSSFDNWVTLALKRFDLKLIKSALRRMDAVVTLAPELASDFAPGVPALVMEGIVPELGSSTDPVRSNHHVPSVVYAGLVAAKYGVVELARAASEFEGDWILEVYGSGPDVDKIRNISTSSARVRYGGVLRSSELSSRYLGADCLVNPRPIGNSFVRYSFPSKLMEYMASGTPVVTTRLPTLPADYEPHLVVSGETAFELASSIGQFLALPRSARREFGSRARDFIVATRNAKSQGRRIVSFLEVVARRQVS